jgi:uncharacterized protein YjlB
MPLTDQIKNYARKAIESRPDEETLRAMVRARAADGPCRPGVWRAIIDAVFESNGWARSWRDTIYDFVHYHSQIHEAMGVPGLQSDAAALDAAELHFGPAACVIEASRGFLVVGAYPADGTYDECTDTRERADSAKRIAKTRKPAADPVFGKRGPLKRIWAGKKR